MMRICSIDGCERPVQARGWCFPHYNRWRNHGDPLGGRAEYWARAPEDVWAQVEQHGPDECWPWIGPRKSNGYGDMRIAGFNGAHRIAFFVATGIDPGDLFVCHACDNPPCCNPKHLFLGTPQANAVDAVTKGRMSRGELNGSARLSEAQVLQIRQLASSGVRQRDIARRFGISQAVVGRIHKRKNWAHV